VAEPEELFTVEEVAAYLKVNKQTVRNWIQSGIPD
jgi:excisionase family DNA binding protein